MRLFSATQLQDPAHITHAMLRGLILLLGCWLVLLANYILVDGFAKLAITANELALLLGSDLFFLAAMNRLREDEIGQDWLDVTLLSLLFNLALLISYELGLDCYSSLGEWLLPLTRFTTYWLVLRCILAPTSQGAEGGLRWIWPPIGPIGLLTPGRWRATFAEGKAGPVLVWLGMLALAIFAASPIFSKTEPEWRRVMLGLLTLVLFWRYFGAILLGTTKIVADETASRAELDALRANLPPQIGPQELEMLHTFSKLDVPTKVIMLGAFRDLATESEPTPPDGEPPAGGWPGTLRLVK